MFANLFSRIGLSTAAEQTEESDGGSDVGVGRDVGVGNEAGVKHFSESEFMDSGLASSDVPVANLSITELNALDFDEGFVEEYVLSKVQDVQRRLRLVRERKSAIADELSGKVLEAPKRRLSDRIFVASHRLPLQVSVDKDGEVHSTVPPSGLGLMSAFRDLLETMPIRWLGAATQAGTGAYFSAESQAKVRASLEQRALGAPGLNKPSSLLRYVPVFTSAEDAQAHHNFCASIIWPLFHYMPLSFEGERSFTVDDYESYGRVNAVYADALVAEWEASGVDEADAMFWIHDFHFLLVPRMLRERLPKARIGFFLHTPFPSGEVFRTFPVRKEILEGILGADLVGFHTYDYARHFLSCCERLLGRDVLPNGVDDKGLFVRVGIYPYGIDTDVFRATLRKNVVQQRVRELRTHLHDKKIILGIDRLDYIKGIPHKLLAMEHFLESNPHMVGKVVLLQVVAPSLSKSVESKQFRAEILETVGRINGRFSTLDNIPIHYRECFLTYEELCALYACADVAVMTSLRDGMNLASYEFVICQGERRGVLVLSEFTGAAQNLPGALLCNPWDLAQVSDCILQAVTMPKAERELKFAKLERFVAKHTAAAWGVTYIDDLVQHANERKKQREKLVRLPVSAVTQSYRNTSGTRLLLLDYDGTLRHFESQPELAEPSERVVALLQRLASDPRNLVFIVTGRQKAIVSEWLGGIGLGFSVEHGFSLQWPAHWRARTLGDAGEDEAGSSVSSGGGSGASGDWEDLLSPRDRSAMRRTLKEVGETLLQFADYTPSTFVETKESSYSWHFRDADPDFAGSRALDARSALDVLVAGTPMEVLMGQKILTVRPRGVHKGSAASEIARRVPCSWILSVGDDTSDEDMFKAMLQLGEGDGAPCITTCTVGRKNTAAQYYVDGVDDVLSLLDALLA